MNNRFSAKMLFHHFLGEEDLKWLAAFHDLELSEDQNKVLIFLKENGAIDNATYRNLLKTDTLSASKKLTLLRTQGLIEKKGNGSATYYTAGPEMIARTTRQTKTANDPQLSPNDPQLGIPPAILSGIKALGSRPRIERTQEIVLDLCHLRAFSAEELTGLFRRRDKRIFVKKVLSPLLAKNFLERTIPESPHHPYQKYRIKSKKPDSA